MADFKLRAPPRLRLSALVSIGGVIGQGAAVPLAGSALASAQAAAALLRGVNLGGAASASAQATAALLRGLRLQGAAVAGASASASFNWFVPRVTLLNGAAGLPAGQSNVAATLPGNYKLGGLFLIEETGTPLPSGMTFSESGLLDVGSAEIDTINGVLFQYYEPAALATLTLHPNATSTLPYIATWYPPETVVPAGLTAVSPDDANLRGSVLSAWPDGSAQVIVVAGETAVTSGVTKTIRLRAGAPTGTALTTARISAIVSAIAVNFGGGVQTLTLSGATPDRTWWANESTICARYRLSCNVGALEAVIDIHAFRAGTNDSALVEVVIENSRMDSASPSKPATQTYTNATVGVNGTTIATVSSPTAGQAYSSPNGSGTYTGGHEAFRAWYCSAKVVGGTVTALTTAQQQAETFGIAVTHDTASMQAHPLFHKMARASTKNMATAWANATFDTYQPWRPCRVRVPNMAGTADYEEIGPLTLAQTDYLQTGNVTVARAIVQQALGTLCCNINYRDSVGNTVTTLDGLGTKSQHTGTWQSTNTEPTWEVAHHPAHGLLAFMLRPSPCFIEIAQKNVVWNKQWTNPYSVTPDHPGDVGTTGAYGLTAQTRGKAWCVRSHSHALFLTPDGHPWKAGAKTYLHGAFRVINTYRTAANERLGIVYNEGPMPFNNLDYAVGSGGFFTAVWQNWFLCGEVLKVAEMRYLTGSDQQLVADVASWLAAGAARYVNESPTGEWRFHGYFQTVGTVDGSNRDMVQSADWGTQLKWAFGGSAPASVSGNWLTTTETGNWATVPTEVTQGDNVYVKSFVYALAMAKERGYSGASTAWATMEANVTGLSAWRDYWQTDARWGAEPRA
jgi:hypothetical protein